MALSLAQEPLWFLEQFNPGTTTYTIPVLRRLRGPMNASALAAALDAVVDRHDSLRQRFPKVDDGVPQVAVADSATMALRYVEATPIGGEIGQADQRNAETRLRELLDEELAMRIDLTVAPFRAVLFRLAADDHALLLAVHHLAIDGGSVELLLRELFTAYEALCAGRRPVLPRLPVWYRDFARWQRIEADRAASTGTWLSGVPSSTAYPRWTCRPIASARRCRASPWVDIRWYSTRPSPLRSMA